MSLLLRVSTSLSVPLVHVVLDLGHDVLGALHRHRDPSQVRYLDLLLKGFRHKGLLVLSALPARVSAATATSSQSRSRGKALMWRLLGLRLLKGVEPLDLGRRVVKVVAQVALGQRSEEWSVSRTSRYQRSVVAEPTRRLSTSITYHLAIVLTEI